MLHLVSTWTGIPVNLSDQQLFDGPREELHEDLIGQDSAVTAAELSTAGMRTAKTCASFIFAGPTGVKHLRRQLWQDHFGDEGDG